MAHDYAKWLLRRAESLEEREHAVDGAINLGMPLQEIEEYLDWLDSVLMEDMERPGQVEKPVDES